MWSEALKSGVEKRSIKQKIVLKNKDKKFFEILKEIKERSVIKKAHL